MKDMQQAAQTAYGTAVDVKTSLMRFVRQHMESILKKFDFITRKEFDHFKKSLGLKKSDHKMTDKPLRCSKVHIKKCGEKGAKTCSKDTVSPKAKRGSVKPQREYMKNY